MITFEQAKTLQRGDEIHREDRTPCLIEIGPRGGRKVFIDVWRVSGKMQTWKTRPGEFSIPIKWGFYGPSAYLTHLSASYFHLANDCPQRVKIEEERQITESQADDDGNNNVGSSIMPHLFTFNGHGTFSPDGKVTATAEEAAAINANTDKMELAHWATKPDLFVPAYYVFPELQPQPNIYYSAYSCGCNSFGPVLRSAEVRTWGGSPLGHITSAHVYSHNFGGRIVSIRVQGTNGANYYGRASWDNGNVIRLRKARS